MKESVMVRLTQAAELAAPRGFYGRAARQAAGAGHDES